MPTYDYECKKCGHIFEYFQNITDEPIDNCPECKGEVKRIIGTGAGIIFKGSGFYQTDYKNSCPASSKTSANADKSPSCEGCPKNK